MDLTAVTRQLERASSILLSAVAMTDLDGVITFANPAFVRMWGYEGSEEVVGRPYFEFFEPREGRESFQEALRTNGHWTSHMIGIRKDGVRIDIEASAAPLNEGTESNGAGRVLICVQNISPQREAEAALVASEQRLSAIFNATPDSMALFRMTPEGELIFEAVNQSYRNCIRSINPEFGGEFLGRKWTEVMREVRLPTQWFERFLGVLERAAREASTVAFDMAIPEEAPERFFEVQIKPLVDSRGRCTHLFWMGHEVTRQKRIEATLRESEQRLSLIFNASSDAQALYRVAEGTQLILVAANQTFRESFRSFLRESTSPLEGKCRSTVMRAVGAAPQYIEAERIACRDAVENGVVRSLELPIATQSGPMFFEVKLEPVISKEKRCTHLLWTARDVTFRRRAEQEVRASEEMYRLLFEQMPDGVFVTRSVDEPAIQFSESWAASLGYEGKQEFASLPLRRLTTEEEGNRIAAVFTEAARERQRKMIDVRFLTREGVERRFELHVAPLWRGDEVLFQCIARDITEYAESQAQASMLRDALAHVARVGTMGEMASGLAHELNQPLGALHLYASSAKMIAERYQDAELAELLEKICDQSLRAGQIIRRMRAFVGRNQSLRQHGDINQLIREVLLLLDGDLRRNNVAMELRLDQGMPKAWVDGIQIQQVLVNLIRNALDAMAGSPAPRRLTIETRALESSLEVEVSDTGKGIDPSVQERLFQPFTSSKPSGMGLGLAICKTLVEAHGGAIAGIARPDGATFRFTLPVVKTRASA